MPDYSVAIFANNKHKSKLKSIENELDKDYEGLFNVSIKLFRSSTTTSIRQLTHKAAFNYKVLIAVGGDGTLHEVLNGIIDAKKEKDCVLGFIPAGSANDFHKTLRGAKSLKELLTKLASQKITSISIGRINYMGLDAMPKERYFLNIASLGMGYEVMQRVNSVAKKGNADFTYFKSIVQTFASYKNRAITCKTAEWEWQGKIKLLALANGKYFGSGLCIAPHANPYQQDLAVTIVGDVSLFSYLLNLLPLKLGKYIKHPQVFYKNAHGLQITLIPLVKDF